MVPYTLVLSIESPIHCGGESEHGVVHCEAWLSGTPITLTCVTVGTFAAWAAMPQ